MGIVSPTVLRLKSKLPIWVILHGSRMMHTLTLIIWDGGPTPITHGITKTYTSITNIVIA